VSPGAAVNRARIIWVGVLAVYVLFWVWYTGYRGPLTPQEIEMYMERMQRIEPNPERLAQIRKFLEEDTGRDFVVVNLIKLRDRPLRVGAVTADESSRHVVDRYMAYMTPAMLARASHPVIGGEAAAAALEAWGVENGEGWSLAAVMRYRSRRDLMEIATQPDFQQAHEYKIAAIEKTIAVPVDPVLQVAGPRVLLALVLITVAALLHLLLARPARS
jgi:hypothetical protein